MDRAVEVVKDWNHQPHRRKKKYFRLQPDDTRSINIKISSRIRHFLERCFIKIQCSVCLDWTRSRSSRITETVSILLNSFNNTGFLRLLWLLPGKQYLQTSIIFCECRYLTPRYIVYNTTWIRKVYITFCNNSLHLNCFFFLVTFSIV